MAETPVVLGYWAIRGRAQVSRFLLEYLGIKYSEKRYTDLDSWFKGDKYNLGFEFPNLPYLIDGDFKLTESEAIERYLIQRAARSDTMLGATPTACAATTMLIGVVHDLNAEIARLVMNNEFDAIKNEKLDKSIAPKLMQLDKYMGEKPFLQGDTPTYPDFGLYEVCVTLREMFGAQKIAIFTSLARLMANIESLNQIRAYFASERYIHAPFFAPSVAKWTGL